MLEGLVDPGSVGSQSVDSAAATAHRCAAGGKGTWEQGIGRSRRGRTIEIHAVANASGRLIAFDLAPTAQMGDVWAAPDLIAKLPKAVELMANTANDRERFRKLLITRRSTPVIEDAFSYLKDWRRVATRYDKLARNSRATVTLNQFYQSD